MNDDEAWLAALTEVFDSGRRLVDQLYAENQRLRALVAKLETGRPEDLDAAGGRDAGAGAPDHPRHAPGSEPERPPGQPREGEVARRLAELEAHHRELLQDYADLERQNSNFLSLYVASSQIHATLVFDEVLRNIKEILINLVGADIFSIYVYEESGRQFRRAAHEGNLDPADEFVPFGDNLISQVVRTGSFKLEVQEADLPSGQQPIAILPLRIGSEPVGVVVIFRLLVQKEAFDAFDLELFDLLAAHAATALMSSFRYQRLERKVLTLQGLLDLFKTGVTDGGG
ncbi:MAG TPA: GAF domain-containing protein [Polyangiaceae bacterium]|nr:GAF domain-containing protein [Polyangiaceae bacterium]